MRIAIVAFSSLASDSRVLRTARALRESGNQILLIGYGPAPADLDIEVALLPNRPRPTFIRAGILLRQLPANVIPRSAHMLYWTDRARRHARRLLEAFRPDVIHANDWNTLPLAHDAKERYGARFVYDTHEMATAEFEDSKLWRLIALSHVRMIEQNSIGFADAVITVSPGIGDLLKKAYPQARDPVVVRNVPNVAPCEFHPTKGAITALFHGHLRPGRGLEALVSSVPHWNGNVKLALRGDGLPDYISHLKQLAHASGGAHRIEFLPPVASADVVRAASEADIGFTFLVDSSRNNRYALPNKLFEYLAAGLCVVASPLPEMAEILRTHGCGVLAEPEAGAISRAINALTPSAIDAFKKQALTAAADLSWSQEQRKLIAVYDGLHP